MVRRRKDNYVLRVEGNSMIEEQIRDGDYIVVQAQSSAEDGQMVVALVGGEAATVKKLYREPGGRVRLQPANPTMEPIFVDARDVRVQGIVVGVIRKYSVGDPALSSAGSVDGCGRRRQPRRRIDDAPPMRVSAANGVPRVVNPCVSDVPSGHRTRIFSEVLVPVGKDRGRDLNAPTGAQGSRIAGSRRDPRSPGKHHGAPRPRLQCSRRSSPASGPPR
jgi:hypothetical protein